jgi:hypothetical protein
VATPSFSDTLEHILCIPQSHICLRLETTTISVVGFPSADNISSNKLNCLCEVSLAHTVASKDESAVISELSKHHSMKMYGGCGGGCKPNFDHAKDGSERSAYGPTN